MLCRCSSYLQKNNKHPNFEEGGRGGVQILLFFEVTQFEYNVSTILLPIVGWGKWYHFGFGCDRHNRQQNCWDFALKWGYFEE